MYHVKNKSWKKFSFDLDDDINITDFKKTAQSPGKRSNKTGMTFLPRSNTKSPASILNNSLSTSFQKKRSSLKQIQDEFIAHKFPSEKMNFSIEKTEKAKTFHEVNERNGDSKIERRKKRQKTQKSKAILESMTIYPKNLSNSAINEKIQENRKKNLLKQFEIKDEKEINEFLVTTPTTEIMKHTISIFNHLSSKPENETKKKKEKISSLTFFRVKGTTTRRKLVPCPRDGHSAIIINDKMIIIGGDRHQRQYHDIFELDLKLLLK